MTNSEIYYLAGKCLIMDKNPQFRDEFITLCKNNLIDWIRFVETCSNNFVLPLVFLKFRDNGVLEHIPEELQEHLSSIYQANLQRNKEILRQIQSTTALLNKHNISPMYLKGAGNLIDGVYSDLGERMMGDIDILVDENDYLTSAEIMRNAGYSSYVDLEKVDVNHITHYPPLYHPDFVCDIEIHRSLTGYSCSSWYNPEIVNSERQTVRNLAGCYVQSYNHKIIHNFIHGQLAHKGYLYGWVSLRDIYDLYIFAKHHPLAQSLQQIQKRKNRAIAYFAFTKMVFGLNEGFFSLENKSYKSLKKRHDFSLNSRAFSVFLYHFLDNLFIKFIYSKETKKYVARRLSSGQFYKNLLYRTKQIFRKQ